MKRKRVLVLAMVMALSVAEVYSDPLKVACIGDSITWGSAMTNRVAECYPTVLQELLGAGYEVRNFGDPGSGVYEHCRRDGRPKAWRLRDEYAKVKTFSPDIIVSNLGINDAEEFMKEFAPGGLPRGTFRDQYISLLESFTAGGKRPRLIIWSKLGPTGKNHRLKKRPNASLMERALDEVAERTGAETLDMLTPLMQYVETADFAADGIHPEGRAQRAIAEATAVRIDLNAAIVRTSAAGGGRVTVPGGRHFSAGPVVLRDNVELHLRENTLVEFSDRLEDYLPGVPVSWEGNECVNVSPLVYAYGCTNVSITGSGTLKPRLEFWRTWYVPRDKEMLAAIHTLKNEWAERDVPVGKRQLWKLPGAKFRPQFFHFNRCRNVRLEDFKTVGTPFWTLHFFLCDGVVARNLDIDAYDDFGNWIGNSDGIDLECTKNALVEGCRFHQHDDAIVIKSGKDRDGRRIATPTENVVVRNCIVRGGPTFVAVGSELSGGVRNVRVEKCRITDTAGQLVHIKTNPRRGGFVDGVVIEDVTADNVRRAMVKVTTDYYYGCPGEERLEKELTTAIGGLTFRNIRAAKAQRCWDIGGDPDLPIDGLTLENVTADTVSSKSRSSNVRFGNGPGKELWSSPWTEVTPQNGVWDEYYRRTDDPANCSFRFRVMRYAGAIGVEALVRDDSIVVDDCPAGSISCPTWKDDCLEVFFDGDDDRNPNTRGPDYETNPTPCNAGGEYAIAANGSSQSDYASAKKCFGTLWGGTAEAWSENGKRVGTRYMLWFRYGCLNRPTPRPDEPVSFGFTICVHDDDDGGANDLALYWKGNPKIPYADESAFGRFMLPPVK